MNRLIVLLSALVLAIGASALLGSPAAAPRSDPVSGDLTVVELFTSQGCSSCPPANANLQTLASRPDILALSWGVTYWDQLGWKDTFAADAYTRRQRDYQRGLGTDNVWTPQVVVDGRRHVVGQRMAQIEALIAQHTAFTGPQIVIRNGGLGLAGGQSSTAPADIWLVRYEPRPIEVPVAHGENGGRTLPHANVVRELVRLGDWTGTTTGIRLPATSRPELRTAVLIQAANGGPILSAARG